MRLHNVEARKQRWSGPTRTSRRWSARLGLERIEDRAMPSATTSIVPGELIVKFKPGISPAEIARFYVDNGLTERESLDRHAVATASRLKLAAVPPAQTEHLAASLQRDPRVEYAEPNYLFTHA